MMLSSASKSISSCQLLHTTSEIVSRFYRAQFFFLWDAVLGVKILYKEFDVIAKLRQSHG